jgi:hypothetical protein
MNDKYIKITGCHDCDKRGICVNAENPKKALFPKYWCPLLNMNVMKYVDSKTIHPDCPLDDYEEQGWISVVNRRSPGDLKDGEYYVMEMKKAYLIDGSFMDWDIPSELVDIMVTHCKPLPQKPDAQKGEG